MTDEEIYIDERPDVPNGNWGGGFDDGIGGIGGGGWGWGVDDNGDGDSDNKDKEEAEKKISLPYLKISESGYLVTGHGKLLESQLNCGDCPAILLYVKDPSDNYKNLHGRCVIVKLAGIGRRYTFRRIFVPESQRRNGLHPEGLYFSWMRPGKFELWTKWQNGHWNHAKVNQVWFAIYGVGSGWIMLPMRRFAKIATIEIDDTCTIWVNGVKAHPFGNAKILERQ